MKKEVVERICTSAMKQKRYMVIHTNIPHGRGINGVAYSCYLMNYPYAKTSAATSTYVTGLEFLDDVLELHVRHDEDAALVYIDYATIDQILVYKSGISYLLKGIN